MKKILIAVLFLAAVFTANSQQIAKWKITDVEKYIAAKNGDVLVINFWASFCKPCVAEIPSFIKIVGKYKSSQVKLMLVSLDLPSYYPTKIASFAKQHHFNTNIVWLQETNADYFCPKIDTAWSGSIPATLIVNTKTGQRKFFEGEMTETEFEAMLKEVTGDPKSIGNLNDHSLDTVEEVKIN
ncbi:MAG: TlpA disulfide reductase family protein [Ferruginibacter sp.]